MNYKDVALLNDSLDQLGQGLLKKRMLDMQERERQAQTGLESQRLGVAQQRWNSQEAHNKAMEDKADQANTLAGDRAAIQDKQKTLQTIIQANSAGQIEDLTPVNDWLSTDPHFQNAGIRLVKPPKPNPQAGQNSAAQLAQQIDYWRQKKEAATTYEERADYTRNEEVLTKIFERMAEPQPKPSQLKKSTTITDPTDPNKKTSLSGPAAEVDAAMRAGAGNASNRPVLKMVRDASGKLVPATAGQ